jgi:hypothetical protein
MPMTGGSYVHPPSTHGPTERLPTVSDTNMPIQHVSGSYGNNVTHSLGLGYWLESGHLTDPGQIAEY